MHQEIIFSPRLIKEGKMSLNKWLRLMNSGKREQLFPNNCFPSDDFLNEYIEKIDQVTDKEFKNLLRMLIVNSGNYGADRLNSEMFKTRGIKEYPNEYYRRLIETDFAYEGLTWILDLLSISPRTALSVLEAYSTVHFMTLPDTAIDGLLDAQVVIRARYFQNNYSLDTLLKLTSREFEYLIAKLYKELGYKVHITPGSRDGGKDVVAENDAISKRERLFIECKRHKKKIGKPLLTPLLGTITNDKATKGVLIGIKGFSKPAIEMANENLNLELISGQDLLNLLDENLGKNWFDFIPKYIRELS
jgi:restriction system protein